MVGMGTPADYPQVVPNAKWIPPNEETAAAISEVVAAYEEVRRAEERYRVLLARATDPPPGGFKVPIAHIAERLGIMRKTVYRHLGRSMT